MIFRRNQNHWKQPERRQHIRIVTLRNFGWLSIAMIIVFAAITIRSEMRGRHAHDYGRLYDGQMKMDIPEKPPVEVVQEAAAPVADHTPSMNAMVVEPMSVVPLDVPQQATITSPVVAPRARDSRVAIVGGPEGLTVVQQTEKRPRLKGGFGR